MRVLVFLRITDLRFVEIRGCKAVLRHSRTRLIFKLDTVIYALFNRPYDTRRVRARVDSEKVVGMILLLFSMSMVGQQPEEVDLTALIYLGIENNAVLKANELQVEKSDALINSAVNLLGE
tara:strand:- start:28 stop:390 length:363 start_codon:yes stop_codon:yes gene_type:complete